MLLVKMETCFVVIFFLLLLWLGELIYKPIKFKSNILRYIGIAPCYLLCKEPNIFWFSCIKTVSFLMNILCH